MTRMMPIQPALLSTAIGCRLLTHLSLQPFRPNSTLIAMLYIKRTVGKGDTDFLSHANPTT